ncbi:MAG: hypothetical protein V7722_07795 [Porticoccus sp.]
MSQENWNQTRLDHICILEVLHPPEKIKIFLDRVNKCESTTTFCVESYLDIVKEEFGMIASINARFFFNRALSPSSEHTS